jgi:hypothetical protein
MRGCCVHTAVLAGTPPFIKSCTVWCVSRVGQNRVYTPYMAVYLVIFLPEIHRTRAPYIHRIHMVLANPMCFRFLSPSTWVLIFVSDNFRWRHFRQQQS